MLGFCRLWYDIDERDGGGGDRRFEVRGGGIIVWNRLVLMLCWCVLIGAREGEGGGEQCGTYVDLPWFN